MMWRNYIFYALVIVLNDWFSRPIRGETENNYNCNRLFSSEQCGFINALRSDIYSLKSEIYEKDKLVNEIEAKQVLKNNAFERDIYQLNKQIEYLRNIKCETSNDVKGEIIEGLKHTIREELKQGVENDMLGEIRNEINEDIRHDIRGELIDELSYRLFNISKRSGRKQQVQTNMNGSWYSTPHKSTARLLTPAKNYLESWNAFISAITANSKSSSTHSSANYVADRVYFEEVSNTFAAGTAGVAALVAIASIGVGLGIGGQIHQTLQNTDGVDQNAREAMSLVERLSIVEEYVRENKRNIEANYEIITHLVISLKQTCERMDLTGAADNYDCCISAESTADIHERSQMVCGSRAGGVNLLGIDTTTICPVCPANLIGARRR